MDIDEIVRTKWTIARLNPPIPGEYWMACHKDYDGPEDDRCGAFGSEKDAYEFAYDYERENYA